MRDQHIAYAEAQKVSELVNAALTAHPITAENWHNWQLFVRTVQTDLTIVAKVIDKIRS